VLPRALHAAESIDLSGEWRFALDPKGSLSEASPHQWSFPEKIKLPGTVAGRGFGDEPSFQTQWTGDGWRYPEMFKEWQEPGNFKFPFFLQPPRHYLGPAWYQREIEIPAGWSGGALLHLERVHWHSAAWVDGKAVGTGDSLGLPHEFELGVMAPGKHIITLRIDNRIGDVNVGPLSHSVTDHTQGNWNGVVGKIELRQRPSSRIGNLQVYPSADGSLKVVASGRLDAEINEASLHVEIDAPGDSAGVKVASGPIQRKDDGTFEVEMTAKLPGPPQPWNEFHPNLYQASACLYTGDDAPQDEKLVTFGFREPGHKDGRLSINGTPIFLRGTLECCIFPLTGYPPTDVDSWKRIVRICKAHGLNHIRFHSWCPPEAAFIAADELGFYYQVEVSSWANQGAEIGSGRPLDAWIETEGNRMLGAYGNHPSFLLMAYGNEPSGGNHKKWLQDWVARRKAEDPRRFYTTGAGWPVMPGSDFHSSPDPRLQHWGEGMKSIINSQPPNTDFDWTSHVKQHPDAPVVSHEIGQWCAYPNFREIDKYTGHFKARNFEIFRETAKRAGLFGQADDFVMASGKLQALAYKHDIEAALRTAAFGGFQLLDLHDFPGQGTALVGVLDAFWDSKGYITAEEYKRFCGPVVPLARMKKMILSTAETLEAGIELAQFGPVDLSGFEVAWRLVAQDGSVVAKGTLPAMHLPAGQLHALGFVRASLASVKAPAKLNFVVGAADGAFSNSWDLFVYQENPPVVQYPGIVITREIGVAKDALRNGSKVLWNPHAATVRNDRDRPLVAGFSPIFWNTAWTQWQAPHTLGILCDPAHPALAGFPTDFHSNWQWWEVQKDARPFILTILGEVKPILQLIDDWFTNRKLGYVFEARVGPGLLLASAVDLGDGQERRPALRQLRSSLLAYISSDRFSPAVQVDEAALDSLLQSESDTVR
jgi:hypothetical protein